MLQYLQSTESGNRYNQWNVSCSCREWLKLQSRAPESSILVPITLLARQPNIHANSSLGPVLLTFYCIHNWTIFAVPSYSNSRQHEKTKTLIYLLVIAFETTEIPWNLQTPIIRQIFFQSALPSLHELLSGDDDEPTIHGSSHWIISTTAGEIAEPIFHKFPHWLEALELPLMIFRPFH